MGYARRRGLEAFRLANQFAEDKVRQDVRPDIIHSGYTYEDERLVEKDYDGWFIVAHGNKCIVALEDDTVIVGRLNWLARLFGASRNDVDSYGSWKRYYEHAFRYELSGQLPVDLCEAITAALTAESQ